ncbi:MAG TPA: hypothetical protein VGM54_24285 [Chthoniobacter sp.]|jgi:hypothetical protein
MKLVGLLLLTAFALLSKASAGSVPSHYSLNDLKKLDIICFVPGWLPEGYHLSRVYLDYTDTDGLDNSNAKSYVAYQLEYSDGRKGTFTVESAREGIGDRNLDGDPKAEESQFKTKQFGTVFIIFRPGGKTRIKKRIAANWVEDANLKAEEAKNPKALHVIGRYHGLSGYGMTVADFEKIVQSLHPVREK